MKLFATLLGVLALLTGFAGGLRAYTASATASPPPPAVAAPHLPRAQAVEPGVVVRWAPCRPPAVRHGRACVTQVTRTVVVPAPAVTAPATMVAPYAAPTRSQPAVTPSHDGGEHETGDDEGEHEGGGEHD